MTGAEVLDIASQSIWVLLKMAGPVMLIALVVGTGIGILQALMQIQEATIVFVPKILAIFGGLIVLLPFMGDVMSTYMQDVVARIAAP
ncbi:MAG TPA: flagellar biosynthetic protein FliQ [Micropepsaceae bacterium]|nr:flagellar biosynthetic protein FliQ [Micropepsaceae bacterium]